VHLEETMESLRNSILTCLVERSPNSLTAPNLLGLIPEVEVHTLQKELDAMVADGLVIVRKHARTPTTCSRPTIACPSASS